jgi:two-component system, OmpR family, response regulator BaeR
MVKKPLAIIIEDDKDLSFIFSEALHAAGFDTHIIMDGTVALSELDGLKPDVVILDLHLPNQPGTTILKYIRSKESFNGVRVVVTTADARMAEMVEADADIVMIKPIGFNLLRDMTSRLRC